MDSVLETDRTPEGPLDLELPALGLRNYWYPALASWRVRRRPKAIRLLGEQIVVWRDGGRIFALADRCAHRGAALSKGKCQFRGAGAISCPYHGWTFDGATGRCVAKLMEGPDARIAAAATIKAYPVREFAGFVWVFVGDMAAVPLEEDLPACLRDASEWHTIANWRTYRCDWRLLMDNLSHDQHAPYLHRNAPELIFQPIFKHATRNSTEPLDDGRGIGHVTEGGISRADYPGLGHFPPPQERWYRFMKPTGRGKEIDRARSPAVVKYAIRHRHMNLLPSIALIGRPSGDFFTVRWIVPVDAETTLLLNFNCWRRLGALATLRDRLKWLVWNSWAHDWLFSDQDKWIVETIRPGPQLLSRTDLGVVAFRRFALRHARRPNATSSAPAAE